MAMSQRNRLLLLALVATATVARAEEVHEVAPPANTEAHLPTIPAPTPWVQDPEDLAAERGDRLEEREVLAEDVKTVKLRDVVPPIRFESGVAKIPPETVAKLREVLAGMAHLHNVRLHLVGHADSQPLSDALAGVFGDNAGLSRERAGEVAEFIQRALALPPDAIAFEWAGDSRPIATNATEAGRALNRRVEVEVWYDEIGSTFATEEVLVPQEWKRVKVCRTQTVCKMRYFDGHARRARIRNLIPPLRFDDASVGVPEGFVRQVAQALENLEGKANVTVEFIGFTDDAPLTGRAERIYGTHEALSKARAHRVALAVQEALALPSVAVVSDGLGTRQPVASNQTERGRAANRRVEVEFWHDDALQELPEEPQPCPDDPGDEWVTRVYDPPWGAIAPLRLEDGEAVIPDGYTSALARALGDVAGETNARLRFVGYTGNQPLDRRTASVYGDDVGLSVARARRAMERIREDLELAPAQAEHEGRGFVHSNDVVNAGFLQGEDSFVVVEVVYDERARRDDLDGIEITPLVREFEPENPLGLNLMRITVDGEPLDDPGRSSADVQRCTDVALDRADIRFRFDNGKADPRLSVTARPNAVAVPARPAPDDAVEAIHFRMYTNYGAFLSRAEVRVFGPGQSLDADPLGIAPVGTDGLAVWQPPVERFDGPVRELRYLLRAYGPDGRFDETGTQPVWLFHPDAAEQAALAAAGAATAPDVPPDAGPGEPGLLAGYGESALARRNIALGNVGRVHVDGSGIPPQHGVWLAGDPVPVDEAGRFVAETLLPAGTHTVELAVLDADGNGELFLRDLEIERDDWFYVGVADLTLQANDTTGPVDALTGDESPVDYDSAADGRLAFYVNGKFREDWGLVASADTRDGPIDDLFTNFVDKRPESLLRRIDPDYHYPTFGDDGTVEETAPTAGKFFVKLNKAKSHAMWGNFKVGYLDNEIAQVDRGLYGANVHYESPDATKFGEQRLVVDGFAADPGTVPSREEFRGTGGSLYFLRHQDVLQGSERLRVELRDRDSGLVTSVVHLQPVLDYDIDYLQGRILLTEPLSATVSQGLLVRTGGLSGSEAWLVAQYEFTPGFDEMDTLATGGQGQYWFNDFVKLGLTANENDLDGADSSLYATDLVVRRSTDTFFKLQAGRSEGLLSNSVFSQDGGFGFQNTPGALVGDLSEDSATALRGDVSVAFTDLVEGARGTLSLYAQDLGAGYSAPAACCACRFPSASRSPRRPTT
jgi:flagellar motor protein MotB